MIKNGDVGGRGDLTTEHMSIVLHSRKEALTIKPKSTILQLSDIVLGLNQ